MERILAQLARLIQVYAVYDLDREGAYVSKELVLIKVHAVAHERRETLRLADICKAQVVDSTLESFVFMVDGDSAKVDSFIEADARLGRGGVRALWRYRHQPRRHGGGSVIALRRLRLLAISAAGCRRQG